MMPSRKGSALLLIAKLLRTRLLTLEQPSKHADTIPRGRIMGFPAFENPV